MTGTNALLSYVNLADTVSILAANGVTSSLPASNLQDPVVARVWRANALGATTLDLDFGSAQPIGVVAVFGLTAAASDTVVVSLSNLSRGGFEVFMSAITLTGFDPNYGQFLKYFATPLSARYVRVSFVVPSRVSLGYVDVGRLWVGSYPVLSRNISVGGTEQFEDPSSVTTGTKSGIDWIDVRPMRRRRGFSFVAGSAADRDVLRDLQRVAGIKGQILFAPDPTDDWGHQMILGRLVSLQPITQTARPVFANSFDVRQSI